MTFSIIQQIILGILQGITEWIPISSTMFLQEVIYRYFNTFHHTEIIRTILFLHLGTFFAACIYFRKELKKIFSSIIKYNDSTEEERKLLKFLFISTLITGTIAIIIKKVLFDPFYENLFLTGKSLTLLLAVLLFFIGVLQIKPRSQNFKKEIDLSTKDGIFLGFVQGLSVIPGISRSGATIATFLVSKFDKSTAVKLSFLMSLPVILFGNILLNADKFSFYSTDIFGLAFSFIFGILTIHFFIKLSEKINFGWFSIIFAILMILSLFLKI